MAIAVYHRLEVSPKAGHSDPRGNATLAQARTFLDLPVEQIWTRDVFSLFIDCEAAAAAAVVDAFTNQIIQRGTVGESEPPIAFDWLVVVGFRPGVTDNVARSARSAIRDILGRALGDGEAIYTSVEYFVSGPSLDHDMIRRLAVNLLANELIQTTVVMSAAEWRANGIPTNQPAVTDRSAPVIHTVDLDVSDDDLVRLSREGILALTLAEMQAIQAHFREEAPARAAVGLGANPTDVELECIAQTWSEHCKHKIFNARIDYTDQETGARQVVDSCFKQFIRKSTEEIGQEVDWLVSVFHDNAGVIRFNDRLNLVYKVETHNSPTALDPYGGAITGIVGVNRDPLGTGMGAELLLNVWGYCFGSPFTDRAEVPAGLFHPRRLRDQVHKGVIDGGNQSGIPYAIGWEYFDPRYLGKPLVYCGTVGLLPHTILGQPAHKKAIHPGDHAVMVGGRIGKDGIHGATFSSEELHQNSPVQAVQIGDPITQKLVYEFLLEARDLGLYRFITDNGAGGLSSSIGEMSEICGGCDIDLGSAPLKYEGLQPWEILVSEAQERMSLAVQPECLDPFLALAKRRDVEATVLGCFTDTGKFQVRYNGETVAYLNETFMHDGLPQLTIPAAWKRPHHAEPVLGERDLAADLLAMLARLNICSGEYKARQYDHEVKGLSVLKPYVGVSNNVLSDATVSLAEQLGTEGIILAAGVAPRYSDIDTYHMMASVIDLAVRRTIAVGGRLGYIAGLDNFCWPDPVLAPGNPDGAYKAAQLVRANQALYDYTRAFRVPCISGKDSMKNDSTMGGRRISIPPTVLFSTIARMEDVSKTVSLDAKRAGDWVYVVGNTRRELGGSEYYAMLDATGNDVPTVDAAAAIKTYDQIAAATDQELCRSLHTPALGGLAVGFAKIAIGGHLGLTVDLDAIPLDGELSLVERLFSESNSRFIATLPTENRAAFEALLEGIPFAVVGRVTLEPTVCFQAGDQSVAQLAVDDLVNGYTQTLDNI